MKWFGLALAVAVFSVASAQADGPPSLEILARTTMYNVREQKAIFCEGRNIKEDIVWYSPSGARVEGKRGDRVYAYKELSKEPGVTVFPLIIMGVELEDNGTWTCKAGNLNDSLTVVVGDRVYFDDIIDTMFAQEGQTTHINCTAKGTPTPSVRWYKNGEIIGDANPGIENINPKKYYISKKPDNYYLEIKNLNYADTAQFVCKATQMEISYFVEKATNLTVHHKPLLINYETHEELPPKSMRLQEVFAILNEVKNITCSAIAYPPPKYTWNRRINHFDEEIPGDVGQVVSSSDGTVSVLMLQMTDKSTGEYKCTANNTKGVVSVIYHVSFGNKPQAPDYVSWVNATVDQLVFNVSCSKCVMVEEESKTPDPENLAILGYSFMFTPVQEGFPVPDWEKGVEILVDVVDPEDTLFTVGPLQNSTHFYARVRSRNAAGFSEWVDADAQPATTDDAFRTAQASILLLAVTTVFLILR